MDYLKNLGKAVKACRVYKGLSQEQLAEMADTSRSTIARLEAGKSTSLDTIWKVSEVLGDVLQMFKQV